MKRSEPQSIRQIVDQVLNQSLTEQSVLEHRAAYLWGSIVGPGINGETTRRWVKGGVLHVCIQSAAIKNEVMFTRSAIRDEINRALGREVINSIAIH